MVSNCQYTVQDCVLSCVFVVLFLFFCLVVYGVCFVTFFGDVCPIFVDFFALSTLLVISGIFFVGVVL